MSFYCADANGYLSDVASVSGLDDFAAEAEVHAGPIAAFAEEGYTDDPATLAALLGSVTFSNPSAESVRQAIVACAQRAADVLIVSDGTSDEEDPNFVDDTPDMSALAAVTPVDALSAEDQLNDYRLNLAVLSLAARGAPCVPGDPRPICKAWEKRRRAKEEAEKQKAEGAQPARAPAPVPAPAPPPARPAEPPPRRAPAGRGQATQNRFDEWRQARAARQAKEPRIEEPAPGEAGYGNPYQVVPAEAPGEQTLSAPRQVDTSSTDPLGGGINESLLITTTDGNKFVFKPVQGESRGARADIDEDHASAAQREVLASRVDRALGFGLVPNTVMAAADLHGYDGRHRRYGKDTIGAMQQFVPNTGQSYNATSRADRARMGIFDAVIGNLDRHGENYLVARDPKGKLIAIDHGLCFGRSPIQPATERRNAYGRVIRDRGGVRSLRSWALAGIEAGDLSPNEQRAIADKLDAMPWDQILKGATLDEAERSSLFERARRVSDHLKRGQAHKIQAEFNASAY